MIELHTTRAAAPLPSLAPDQAALSLQGSLRAAAVGCVLAALVLVVLAAAIANVALPALGRAFQVPPAMSVRVVTAYQLGLVIALLPCAALGESRGYRAVFCAGIGLFTGASVLCALAPSFSWLAAARLLQGLGGAAVMALAVALLRFSVPTSRLAAAISWSALAVALSSAAGPTLGALLLSWASWPWLFAINLPLGAGVLLIAHKLPDVHGTARGVDVLSVSLSICAFGSLFVSAELLAVAPTLAAAGLAASAVLFALLIRRELPKEAPLVPLDLLRARSFRISVIASVACFAGQTAALVALPYYLQQNLGHDALTAGLMMTVWPLSVALAAPVAGRIADRSSTAWLSATGASCLALGLAAMALWPPHETPIMLVPFMMLAGAGFGLFQVPNNRNMFLASPPGRSAAAGGMQGTARLTGQTAGAVLMTLLFTLSSLAAAPRIGLSIGAILTLTAGIVSSLRCTQESRASSTGREPIR